jgi:hypothetical protein
MSNKYTLTEKLAVLPAYIASLIINREKHWENFLSDYADTRIPRTEEITIRGRINARRGKILEEKTRTEQEERRAYYNTSRL